MINDVYALIDEKIAKISQDRKRPTVIVMNEDLYKRMQVEMVTQSMQQKFGKVINPHDLNIYNNLKIIPVQTVELVEVF